jgi:hypothetical protein
LREIHPVDGRSARSGVEVAQGIHVRWPVITEGNAKALVRKIAIEISRRIFKPMMLPHFGLKVSGVHRHSLINLLR